MFNVFYLFFIIRMMCIGLHPHGYQKSRIHWTILVTVLYKQLLKTLLNVCYTGLLNGILYLKTILLHCHHIIENYCVNLDLLTINCQLKLDGIVTAKDLLEIVINVTWRNWATNLIFSYNVQPYQISEKRYNLCQNGPNIHTF